MLGTWQFLKGGQKEGYPRLSQNSLVDSSDRTLGCTQTILQSP